MPSTSRTPIVNGLSGWQTALEVVLSLVLIFCCVGSVPPGVNESHYLPKAKHAWDNSFASDRDIFLSSSNTHWLASAVAGLLLRFLELSSVAWIGRAACWTLISIAWLKLCRAAEVHRLLRPFGLLAWFLWNHYGNWAGEWFVGGFEAKSVAYPCVLFGLASLLRNQWNRVWIWSGAALAWHPLVGGWVLVGFLAIWLQQNGKRRRLVEQMPGLCLGVAVSMLGIIPALGGIGGNDLEGNISAAQVHCYYRLSHHLSPRTFSYNRNLLALVAVAVLVMITLAARRGRLSKSQTERLDQPILDITKPLLIIAWVAVAISIVGWLLDRATDFGFRHDIAARLLRFYFFRWSDVAVPLTVTLVAMRWLSDLESSEDPKEIHHSNWRYQYSASIFVLLISLFGVWHWWKLYKMEVPPADLLLVNSVGPVPIQREEFDEVTTAPDDSNFSLPFSWGGASSVPERLVDWLAVCEWIRENTPSDSLWLTPRYQQTFKWYAGRAEVVNWKDVPQDSASIIEWYRRIERCQPPTDRNGKHSGWTTDELLELARQYRFQWVLIDRTHQTLPPLLESKYPNLIDNRSFAVFFIPDSAL